MTRGTRIGLAAWGGVVVMLAASVPAGAFTLTETSAALGTANGLAASNGVNAAYTRGVVQRRLAGIRPGAGIPAEPGGFGSCGRGSSSHAPAKNWKRANDTAGRVRVTASWKRASVPSARMTRIAWAKASDPSRCR
jgi:hypothetical protein